MHWNHRVIRQEYEYTGLDGKPETEITYTLAEAYYDEEVSNTVPTSWCEATVHSDGDEGVDGLREQLERMMRALEQPVVVVKNGTVIGEYQ